MERRILLPRRFVKHFLPLLLPLNVCEAGCISMAWRKVLIDHRLWPVFQIVLKTQAYGRMYVQVLDFLRRKETTLIGFFTDLYFSPNNGTVKAERKLLAYFTIRKRNNVSWISIDTHNVFWFDVEPCFFFYLSHNWMWCRFAPDGPQGVSLFDVCTIRMRLNQIASIAAKMSPKLLPDCPH